tara:strand:- start:429 stop:773 length:345 start_codon:yes stop_codon:yes gene_type:complete
MVKWRVGLAAYCVVVLYLSSMSPGDLPDGPKAVSDKLLHFVEYAVMGGLAWAGFGKGAGGFPWGLFAFCACFGIADECWQDWLGHARTPDVWDAAADAAGSFCSLLLCMVFWKR